MLKCVYYFNYSFLVFVVLKLVGFELIVLLKYWLFFLMLVFLFILFEGCREIEIVGSFLIWFLFDENLYNFGYEVFLD